ncbi:MAG: amino acid ABC transporter permease [Clostridia bacterium]|nr:amino acid ABC transporter permease [Clostridia bacterium]
MNEFFDSLVLWLQTAWANLSDQFYVNFIKANRWTFLWEGFCVTLKITVLAAIFGIIIGIIVGMVTFTHKKTGKLKFLNVLFQIYLTVVRGTPVLVQLLIIYFVVFASVDVDKVLVAVIAFSINSGAYVAEIVRGGIQSVKEGQFEAGRSLGFSYIKTMWYIIIPQAVRNIIPMLLNEFITLLKETSICGYIALNDLTRGAYIIQSRTFSPFMPLIAIALIYLVMVLLLTLLVKYIERRLTKNAR